MICVHLTSDYYPLRHGQTRLRRAAMRGMSALVEPAPSGAPCRDSPNINASARVPWTWSGRGDVGVEGLRKGRAHSKYPHLFQILGRRAPV